MLLWVNLAMASPESLGGDARVDWVAGVIEAEARARSEGGVALGVVEELARRALETQLRDASPALRVDCGLTLAGVLGNAEVGDAVRDRLRRWDIAEARYNMGGDVALVGRLSLLELLKPYALSRALPATVTKDSAFTGVVVDARGIGAAPQWMPRLLAPDGAVLHDGTLFDSVALAVAPAMWTYDVVDERVAAWVGDAPLAIRATVSTGCALQLDAEGAAKLRDEVLGTDILRRGRLVIAVDPP